MSTIGPYCVIGPNVAIGDGCKLIAHVHLTGHTTIGARTAIYPFASLGTPPQSVHYRGGPTRLVDRRRVRHPRERHDQYRHRGRRRRHRRVGDHCFFMVGSPCRRTIAASATTSIVRQQRGARRPRDGRRLRVFCGGQSRGAPVHADRRGRHGRRRERRARPTSFRSACAIGRSRASRRPQRRRAAAPRLFARRHPGACARAYRLLFDGEGTFAERVDARRGRIRRRSAGRQDHRVHPAPSERATDDAARAREGRRMPTQT